MNRITAICCAFAALAIGTPGVAESTTPQTPKQIRITAATQEINPGNQDFRAQGDARVVYGETILTADRVFGNASNGEIEASGDVHFTNQGRLLTGNTFRYNFKTDIGYATNANAESDHVYFHGAEMKAEPGKYTLTGSRFSTCDQEKPHYYLSARELIIEPDSRLVAKNVSIVVYGKTVFHLPIYSTPIGSKKKDKGFKMPAFGFGDHSGIFAGYQFDLGPRPDTSGTLDLRLSSKWLLQGGVKYEKIGGGPFFARATYREPFYGGDQPDVVLHRLPEIGYRFGNTDSTEVFSTSRDSMNLSRGLIKPLGLQASEAKINLAGELTAGLFAEDPDFMTRERFDARALTWLKPVEIGKDTFVSPGLFARVSHYGSGDNYTDLGVRLAAARRFGSKSYVSLAYIAHSIHGDTPFHFDAVDLQDELAGRVGFPIGSYKMEIGGRYDLNDHGMFDTEISLAKPLHCLEPKLTWRNRFSELTFSVGLVGF